MPVLHKRLRANFTTIPNSLLQDKRLSCNDIGLLAHMLSRPDNWAFSTAGLNVYFEGRTGKESLAKSIKRLQKLGYLLIRRERSPSGTLGAAVWVVSDSPQPGKPDSGFPPTTKERIKKETASPAFMGGQQPELYFDPVTGEWRRKQC